MAKTSNQEFYDALVRHQIYLLRYSGGLRNRINELLNKTEKDLNRLIKDRLSSHKGLNTPVEFRRLRLLQASLAAIRKESWKEVAKLFNEELTELAYQEPITTNAILKTSIPVLIETVLPQNRLLKSIVKSMPFEGRILKEWAKNLEDNDIRRIQNAVQVGMIMGEGSAAIAQRVVGIGAITELTRTQVEAVTRTAVQHISNNARDQFMRENSDIITAEQFVATLDSRTTPICRANDGKLFALGKGPRPPLHFGCRSLRIAHIDGTLMGDRPAKPLTEKMLVREYSEANNLGKITERRHLPRGTKGSFDSWSRGRIRELTGPVPAHETYQTWLKKQSIAFQNDVLGITKAKLFRDGNLTLDKFVNRKGDELTLAQLAVKHAEAFKAAGLRPTDF